MTPAHGFEQNSAIRRAIADRQGMTAIRKVLSRRTTGSANVHLTCGWQNRGWVLTQAYDALIGLEPRSNGTHSLGEFPLGH
jgi:hypothetical protein